MPGIRALGLSLLLGLGVVALPPAAAEEAEDTAAPLAEGEPPAHYLHFSEQFNARCESLSSGGKMISMRNRHPRLALRYRMVRIFSGAPQAGRAVGVLLPGAEPVDLGCNRVDRRKQYWEVERLSLEEIQTDSTTGPSPTTASQPQ